MTDFRTLALCADCPLHGADTYVPGSGPIPAALMAVGESAGKHEVAQREPMVGKSGQELDQYLWGAGTPRENCRVTNILGCRPPNDRDPKPIEIECCRPRLLAEIAAAQPRVILALGAFAMRWFLGDKVDMEAVRGIPHPWAGGSALVVPTYHPAYGLRNTRAMEFIQRDIQAAADVVRGKGPLRPPVDGHPHRCYRQRRGFSQAVAAFPTGKIPQVAVDTETATGQPWCLSFATNPGTADIVMADDREGLDAVKAFLASSETLTVLHNALYDLPVLHALGIHPARTVDTMVMAYLLGTEPQSLKALAYRHAGMVMQSHDEVVYPYSRERAFEYLRLVAKETTGWPPPEPILEWPSGDIPHVRQPQPVAKRVARILKDEPDDPWARWRKIDGREVVEAHFGPIPVPSIADVPIEKAVRYAGGDADATLRIYPHLYRMIQSHNLGPVLRRDMSILPMVVDMQTAGMLLDREYLKRFGAELQVEKDEVGARIDRLAGRHINPGSPLQVSRLLYGDLKLGRDLKLRRTVHGFSTDDGALSRLEGAHAIIAPLQRWRELSKLKGTYVDRLPILADGDGRVRPTIRVTRTATGRLSCSEPNLMGQPTRTKDGARVREGFVAAPGCVLASVDYSQIEMRVTAHLSGDEAMQDIFHRGADIHTETAARMFRIPIDQVDERKHRYPAKGTGFGILYQISGDGLYREFVTEGIFDWTAEECDGLIEDWFNTFPGVRRMVRATRSEARRHGLVRDMWGRIRYIPEVRSALPYIREAGLRQAVNTPIQSGAQGIIKEAMGRLVPLYREWQSAGMTVRPLLQIHDDLLWEVGEAEVGVVIPEIKRIMEAAVTLTVPVVADAKVGPNWRQMEKWEECHE